VAAGFTNQRAYLRMRRDLAAPIPDLALPDALTVKSAAAVAEDSVRQAHHQGQAEAWGEGPMTPELWHRRWGTYSPDWSFVVLDTTEGPDAVVGYVLTMPQVEALSREPRTEGLIHRLGVVTDHRGRGIGRSLAALALKSFGDSGLRFASAMVDPDIEHSGFELYDALGFAPTSRALVYGVNL